MGTLITIIHLFAATILIIAVLLQSGKGGMGATFGGAATQIFGGRGASNFLTRVTSTAAITFFATSLALSMMFARHRSPVERSLTKPAATESAPAPVAPASSAPEATPPAEAAPAAPSAPAAPLKKAR